MKMPNHSTPAHPSTRSPIDTASYNWRLESSPAALTKGITAIEPTSWMNHISQTSLNQINAELTDLKAFEHHRNTPSEPIKKISGFQGM